LIKRIDINYVAWTRVHTIDAAIGKFETLDYMFVNQHINDGFMIMFDCSLEIGEVTNEARSVGWKVKIER
jgi:hypothetical protein